MLPDDIPEEIVGDIVGKIGEIVLDKGDVKFLRKAFLGALPQSSGQMTFKSTFSEWG
ncbi:hypothetical protein [Neobacillus sp. 204]|uniref:hypothetical protein n=1 Tax=Neobacillus sp. 204 TaxID=3383351 RepID=UPI003979D736